MSATMRIDDFKNITLFNFSVPILKVEARMFPVTTFYEKNTPEDYKKAAIKKCVKIHRTLPDGDVLIFLTGKEEIHEMKVLLEQELERQNFLES
jgi:ATP-dependent RNA helicase DHX37/DHR1